MTAVSLAGAPIPVATVQPAPAADPLGLAAGAPLAPLAAAAPDPAAAAAAPGATLEVPAEFLAKLDAAVADGIKDARAFAAEHTPAERWMIPDWALLKMAFPPRSDEEDLAYLHQVERTRTPEGIERARYWSKHGLTDEWEAMLEPYLKQAGPAQARAAKKLLHDALMMVNNVTQTGKSANARKRPFAVDPTLTLAVDKPGNNPSYPSGHTSAAFAAALVLSHLMPDRRAEFLGLAHEASWARVYSGVHFPTDVIAGAKLAATVASHLTAVSMARPITGTAPAVNPGVAGGRRRLEGAVQLAGQPLQPAAPAPLAPSPAAGVMQPGQPGT